MRILIKFKEVSKVIYKGQRFVLLLVLYLLQTFAGYCQDGTSSFDNTRPAVVIPPSPVAASLFKDVGNSVSYYTGTEQLSIPLWNVSIGSLKVPVSLNYATSATRVSEEASLTGLGWNLNAGGVISRSVVGLPDESTGKAGYRSTATILNFPSPGSSSLSFETALQNAVSNTTNGMCNAYMLSNGTYELTPDLYYLNFNGHSAKLFFDQNNKPYITPNKAWQISSVPASSGYGTGYRVVTEEGEIYDFTATESSQSTVESSSGSVPGGVSGQYVSSWFLTRLISADLADTILFNYQTVSYTVSSLINDETKGFGLKGQLFACTNNVPQTLFDSYVSSTQDISSYVLNSISTRNQRVVFQYSNNRTDLDQATGISLRLDSLKIYALNGSGTNLIKKIVMSYDYFSNTVNDPVDRRLKLTGVQEFGRDGTAVPPYQFSYNDNGVFALPSKASLAQDSWGYYNGVTSNITLIPSWIDNYGINNPGGDRSVNPQYAGMGSLKQITYPTGGYTTYEYEGNNYYNPSTDSLVVSASQSASGNNLKNTSQTITITFAQFLTFQYRLTQHNSCDGDAQVSVFGPTGNLVFSNSGCTTSGSQTAVPVFVQPGVYTINASTGIAGELAQITVQYTQHVYSSTMHTSVCGGQRLTRIANYDNINNSVPYKVSRFNYNINDTTSAGVLINSPVYSGIQYTPVYCPFNAGPGKVGDYQYFTQHAASLVTLGRTQGSTVGYSQVTILDGDQGEFGKEIVQYSITGLKDQGGNGYPYTPQTSMDDIRGILLQKNDYDKTGKLVQKIVNTYSGCRTHLS